MTAKAIPSETRERWVAGAWAEVRERQQAARLAARFVRYQPDPVSYARDVLGITWWAKQVEIAESVCNNRRTAVYAGHSVGKTHMTGGLVQWHFDAFDPSITLTTAPSWSSIHDLLWGELANQRPKDAPGRLLDTMRLDGGPMHYAKGHNAENGAGFQGRHEERMLIVIDEAMGVPLYIWEASNAMMTSPLCRMLVEGNPTETGGPYYELRESPDWNVIHISCLEHPNIAAELAGLPAPFPKAVSLTWVAEMIDKHARAIEPAEKTADCFEFPPGSGEWYEPDDIFRSRVLGLFPKQAFQSVWSEAWLEYARSHPRPTPAGRAPEIGADVARYGDDLTVLYGGVLPVPSERQAYAKQPTTETTGRIKLLADKLGADYGIEAMRIPIKVDDTGLGGGVTDMLQEDGYNVLPINAGEAARDPREFFNRRAELWFEASYLARDMALDLSRLPAPVYQKLAAELRSVRYKIQSDKTLRVEGKDETKKRLGHSPDDADAFNLWAFDYHAAPAGAAGKASPSAPSRWNGGQLTGGRWGRGGRSRR